MRELKTRYTRDTMEKELETKFAEVHKSIDTLATMVANGFASMTEHVDQRFEQVDQQFEQVDKQFEQVDKRFDQLDAEIRELHMEVRSIRAALSRIPDNIDATYAPTLNDLLERVARIEKKIGLTA